MPHATYCSGWRVVARSSALFNEGVTHFACLIGVPRHEKGDPILGFDWRVVVNGKDIKAIDLTTGIDRNAFSGAVLDHQFQKGWVVYLAYCLCCRRPVIPNVIAPSKARRILQGESPCRVSHCKVTF